MWMIKNLYTFSFNKSMGSEQRLSNFSILPLFPYLKKVHLLMLGNTFFFVENHTLKIDPPRNSRWKLFDTIHLSNSKFRKKSIYTRIKYYSEKHSWETYYPCDYLSISWFSHLPNVSTNILECKKITLEWIPL